MDSPYPFQKLDVISLVPVHKTADTFGGSELAIPGPNSVVFYLSFCRIFEKVYLQVSMTRIEAKPTMSQEASMTVLLTEMHLTQGIVEFTGLLLYQFSKI
ncbi:hypothetical protein AAG906_028078 [Vitis piasezkii]